MEIRILELIEGAKKAEGLTVIIDVFRAFSLECYLYARGASAVFPAGSVEEARHMKQVHPEYLLIGERWGRSVRALTMEIHRPRPGTRTCQGKKSYILQAREHRES